VDDFTGTISSVSFKLKITGEPTGSIWVMVRDVDTDESLGVLATYNIESLDSGWNQFNDETVEIDTATDIKIFVEVDSGDASNYVSICYANSNKTSWSSWCYYSSGWVFKSSYDAVYQMTYSGTSSATTTTDYSNSDLSDLSADLATVSTNVASLSTQVTGVTNQMNTFASQLNAVTNSLSNVTDNSSQVASINNQIANINSNYSQLDGRIAGISNDVTLIGQDITNIKKSVDNLTSLYNTKTAEYNKSVKSLNQTMIWIIMIQFLVMIIIIYVIWRFNKKRKVE
jgi:methyl-accepting chemotaxis protein